MTQAARPWLAPLVPLYRVGIALRGLGLRAGLEPVRRLGAPVVSIGNLSTGGAGKTPLTIALARVLVTRGLHVDVLSRGYGRAGNAPARVDPNGTAEEFGDEPLVIAREAGIPVYVAAQRYQAGLLADQDSAAAQSEPRNVSGRDFRGFGKTPDGMRLASGHDFRSTGKTTDDFGLVSGHDFSRAEDTQKRAGALAPARTIHLLDDGFQHRQLHRDIDILLVAAADLEDRLLPAGNLREPLEAMRRATVVALTMPEAPSPDAPNMEQTLLRRGLWHGPVWRLHRRMQVPPIEGPVVAFCGIARPDQFFAGLESAGLHIASRIAFADHQRYVHHDIDCVLDAAHTARAVALITTEKDRVRLAPFLSSIPAGLPLKTAGLRIEIEDQESAIDWLLAQLPR
jgi:tetraacyldisaccharide 4'-kinase